MGEGLSGAFGAVTGTMETMAEMGMMYAETAMVLGTASAVANMASDSSAPARRKDEYAP